MFISAYDTLAGSPYNTNDIKSKIKLSMIEGGVMDLKTPESMKNVSCVKGVSPNNDLVPVFNHPLIIDEYSNDFLFMDTRHYLRKERDGTIAFSNLSEYKFQLERCIINKHWIKNSDEMINTGDIAPLIFCKWLSESLTRKLGLGPSEQIRITVITMFYWHSLFRTEEFTEKEKLQITTKLSRVMNVPSNFVMEIFDTIKLMPTIKDYIQCLVNNVGSVRLRELNPTLLFTMLGGSWFGVSSKEVIAISLEHPPTFFIIILTALTSRAYRKSLLGRMVADNNKRGIGDDFTKSFYTIFKGYLS